MAIRRLGGFAFLAATWGILTCGCGAAPDALDNGNPASDNPASNNVDDTTPDDNTGTHVIVPSTEAVVSDFKNAFVISVPLVGASLSGDAAGKFTAMAASLTSSGWGSGQISFDVDGMDWLPATQAVLTDAAARGGLMRTFYLPLAAVGSSPLSGNLVDLRPAPGMATVGVLPIIFVTTDFEGYPASGAGIEVGLWSQQAGCPTCDYSSPVEYQHQITPLISSIEIRKLRELGLWNDRLIAIVAKAGVWWAKSESSTSRVRNWMILQPIGGQAGQVRCLTDSGLWPS